MCQICAKNIVEQPVLPGLLLAGPLRIMSPDGGGTIGQDVCRILDRSAFSQDLRCKRVSEPVTMSPWNLGKLENSAHRSLRTLHEAAYTLMCR